MIDWHDRSTFRRLAPIVRRCPFVVYAGTPQYSPYVRWKDWRMWTEQVFQWGLPILALGGGTLWRRFVGDVDGYVEYCLKHRRTYDVIRRRTTEFACVTVRDPYADALLDALSLQHHYLPCPGTWATKMWRMEPAEDRPFLLLVPSGWPPFDVRPPRPSSVPDVLKVRWVQDRLRTLNRFRSSAAGRAAQRSARHWLEIYQALRNDGHEVRVLCHQLRDFVVMREIIPSADLVYHDDFFTLLREYESAHTVVSARVYGSIPSYGLPGTRVVNITIDTRGSTVDIFPKITNLTAGGFGAQDVVQAVRDTQPSSPEDLSKWETVYDDVITSTLATI